MKVLIVFAHPKPKGSFNHAVLEQFTRGLEDGGHAHEVVDLYRCGFDTVFRTEDYVSFADESIPEDVLEQMGWRESVLEAASAGPLGFIKKRMAQRWLEGKSVREIVREIGKNKPKDVLEQQQKVAWADGIAFIAPVIWMHYPAILKGWVERVFSYGFAYSLEPEGWAGRSDGRIPLLKLERALSMTSTFFTEEDYRSKGFQDAIAKIVDDWGLRYPGIRQVDHVYFWAVAAVDDATRKEYLAEAYLLGREFQDRGCA
jgi:NAD(P)H dehydrogenase (quinone)